MLWYFQGIPESWFSSWIHIVSSQQPDQSQPVSPLPSPTGHTWFCFERRLLPEVQTAHESSGRYQTSTVSGLRSVVPDWHFFTQNLMFWLLISPVLNFVSLKNPKVQVESVHLSSTHGERKKDSLSDQKQLFSPTHAHKNRLEESTSSLETWKPDPSNSIRISLPCSQHWRLAWEQMISPPPGSYNEMSDHDKKSRKSQTETQWLKFYPKTQPSICHWAIWRKGNQKSWVFNVKSGVTRSLIRVLLLQGTNRSSGTSDHLRKPDMISDVGLELMNSASLSTPVDLLQFPLK